MKMNTKLLSMLLALVISLVGCSLAEAARRSQDTASGLRITGVVMDYDTKNPVTNATVRLFVRKGEPGADGFAPVEDAKTAAKVESNGSFTVLGVKPATYTLMVEKSGTFATGRHEDGKSIEVEVTKTSVDVGRVWVQFRR